MLKCFADVGISNWASCIKNMLYSNGFGYVWERQSVENEKQFIKLFIQRLKDQYLQSWFEKINLSSKLSTYRGFKNTYKHEFYLNFITNRKYRRIIAQFRVSAHDLEIERGRYNGPVWLELIEFANYVEGQLRMNFISFDMYCI